VLAVKSASHNADELCARLRQWERPIIARVEEGRVLLDLRTVEPQQEEAIVVALESISQ
jgi:L-seryl-tRNA(Ser) seleniumtransferase